MPRHILIIALLVLLLVPNLSGAHGLSEFTSSPSTTSGLRRRGGTGRISETGADAPITSSSQGSRRVRRRLRQRRRNVACQEPGGNDDDDNDSGRTPATTTNATTVTNDNNNGWSTIWNQLRDFIPINDEGSTDSGTQDTAASRFADAEGVFASGQSVEGGPTSRPSLAPSTPVVSPSAAPSSSPTLAATTSPPTASSSSSTCPDATPSQQVICQSGTKVFPSLCHAKQALGEALTDCLLVDANPVQSGGGSATATTQTATSEAAALVVAPSPESDAAAGAGAGEEEAATSEVGCSENDDDNGRGPLILCEGDMLFASWCDAFRHHFTREQCEEY